MVNSHLNMWALAFQNTDIGNVDMKEMEIYDIKHKRELHTVKYSDQNP